MNQTISKGLTFDRKLSSADRHPYEDLQWEFRTASITNDAGKIIFEQKDVEVPSSWTQLAVNVVTSKYFFGGINTPQREKSVKQLINRVVHSFTKWGRDLEMFASEEVARVFSDELTAICVNQYACFNSPVWFNVGTPEHDPESPAFSGKAPQCSACFINSVEDSMDSIMELAKTEGMLFKYGSGTGTNLSPLRGSLEKLSTGGSASGPVSFMRGYDAFAGVIKSGGKTRRAAKMVILDIDHPDIEEFILCKVNEEKKAWALIGAGYDGSFTGEAYSSVFFQNSNNSVRVTDDFMQSVIDDKNWDTIARTDGRSMGTYKARGLMKLIADAAWQCGDPGLQFDTTINEWHTCKTTDRIYASNPCSEYMFLNDTACNLASINLMKFLREDGTFDVDTYRHVVRIVLTAMEIVVDKASYPRERIALNSHRFRPLGLGYANLGAVLMAKGLAYDSESGRAFAAALTAIMCGEAYRTSADMASFLGPFPGYPENTNDFIKVIEKHRSSVGQIKENLVESEVLRAAWRSWDEALEMGRQHGYRNSQVTVLAPTGTIAFMMDCDTTGIEPDLALVKYKYLAGGGTLKIVNQSITRTLRNLGYSLEDQKTILAYIEENNTVEGCNQVKPEHLPVFDCSFKSAKGTRSIHFMGHVRMMAAVQPFISGAISKTVNMPTNVTPEDIANTYVEAWKLGLNAIAIYRDGCKKSQPLNTDKVGTAQAVAEMEDPTLRRKKLPDERRAITHKFSIAGHEGYITAGMYEDGSLGEIFITMSKEGSTISGLMDSFATAVSIALQYGVPLEELVRKFAHLRFEPAGFTTNPQIPMAKSIMDYIFRWLGSKFLPQEELDAEPLTTTATSGIDTRAIYEQTTRQTSLPLSSDAGKVVAQAPRNGNGHHPAPKRESLFVSQTDAPPCSGCGSIMVRNGSCYKCTNCGNTSGCS